MDPKIARAAPHLAPSPAPATDGHSSSELYVMVRPASRETYGLHESWVCEYKEIQGYSLDIDLQPNCIAFAGRRWVCLVNGIDGSIICKASRASKTRYDVTSLTWCPVGGPHSPRFALSSSDVIEVHSVEKDRITLETSARVHPRAVSDIDWSRHEPHLLASCCTDDPICIWDTRDLRKPTIQLQVLSGASQVKWNPILENIVATGHDCDVRIWDIRKCANPMQLMTCHLSQVRGLKWSPSEDVCFVTCGQDSTIKMWNFGNTKTTRPMTQALLPSPAWKLRYTPVSGDYLVSIPVPQIGKNEAVISVWNSSDLCEPTNQLYGHTDALLDLCCGSKEEGSDLVLYSLARDFSIRKWTVNTRNKRVCQCILFIQTNVYSFIFYIFLMNDSLSLDEMGVTEVMNRGLEQTVVSDRQSLLSVETALDLDSEVDAVAGLNLYGITVEKTSVEERVVEVVAEMKPIFIKLCLGFPQNFEQNKQLSVNFGKETNLPMAARSHLKHCLQEICREKPDDPSKSVLVSCISSLPKILQQLTVSPDVEMRLSGSYGSYDASASTPSPSILFSPMIASNDEFVPFPRTSGARFCSSGFLICFGRLEPADIGNNVKHVYVSQKSTPRSLRELHTTLSNNRSSYFGIKSNGMTVKDFYRSHSRKSLSMPFSNSTLSLRSQKSVDLKFSDVFVYSVLSLLPVDKQLATSYVISGTSVSAICLQNKEAAAAANKPELVSLWALLAHVCQPQLKEPFNPDVDVPWALHPFGRNMINDILVDALQKSDVQTAAVIGCVLGGVCDVTSALPLRPPFLTTAAGAACSYNTISAGESVTSRRERGSLSGMYRERSASFDNQADSLLASNSITNIFTNPLQHNDKEENFELLNQSVNIALEGAKQSYADMLYRWGMLIPSALILKHSLIQPINFVGPRFEVLCKACNFTGCSCANTKTKTLLCCVCQMIVKGLSSVCPWCGHGGHKQHILDWFQSNDACPRACGCWCSRVE